MEHIHVLINDLPVIGLAMAVLALALYASQPHSGSRRPHFDSHRRRERLAGELSGQRAYKPMREVTDSDGTDWLDAHMERAEKAAPPFTCSRC